MLTVSDKSVSYANLYLQDLLDEKRSVQESGTMKSKFLASGNYERYVGMSLAIVEYKYRVRYG